jgi:hypothetical protein
MTASYLRLLEMGTSGLQEVQTTNYHYHMHPITALVKDGINPRNEERCLPLLTLRSYSKSDRNPGDMKAQHYQSLRTVSSLALPLPKVIVSCLLPLKPAVPDSCPKYPLADLSVLYQLVALRRMVSDLFLMPEVKKQWHLPIDKDQDQADLDESTGLYSRTPHWLWLSVYYFSTGRYNILFWY